MKQIKFQLKNKMKVLLIQSSKSPVVSVQMWVKTGSADEKKGEEGISHFIEHLVFKGTDKYKAGQIATLIEASGGELNAFTSFDQTVFYVTISKNYSGIALDVISQMMGYPTFDAEEVENEREVVCEEIKMGMDSPRRRASQLLFSSAFKKHPYGIPVIGYEKNVRSWPVKKIKNYYHLRYVPENMFLVVSGDFDPIEMKKAITAEYSKFKPYKFEKRKRPIEPQQKKYQTKFEKSDLHEQHLNLAFRAPSIKHKDVPALDVLAMILGQGDSSRLVKKLRLEKPLSNGVSASNYNPQDQGIFVISSQHDNDRHNEVVDVVLSEILKMRNEKPSWQEIKRARIIISSEQFYSIETVEGIANKAGSQEFYLGDANAHKKYLAMINKVTPEDVQSVAKKYFNLKSLSVSYLANVSEQQAKDTFKRIEKTWKLLEKQKIKPITKADKKLKIPKLVFKTNNEKSNFPAEEVTLKSGMKVIFKKSKDIPNVTAKFVFKAGARLESPNDMGLSELLSRTWIAGTKNKTEQDQIQAMEELAMGFSAFSGKNTFGFSLDYLSGFENESLDLAVDAVINPIFSENIIEREKQIMLHQIKAKADQPSALCVRQFMNQMFPSHPLSYESLGTAETLKNLDQKKLIQLKNQFLSAASCVVVVVGDFNKETWLKKLKILEESFLSSRTDFKIQNLQPISSSERKFLLKDKEQSHIIIAWRGLSITDEDRYTLEIIQAILAGQGGRLFLELRDKNSLAYSVSPMKMESLESGYFGGYIACSPEKVEKAIEMFQIEFKKLMEQNVSDEEIARSKKYLIGQHDIGLQRKSAICNLIAFDEIYGNDFRKNLDIAKHYESITAEKIKQLASRLFSKPYIISIVGKEVRENNRPG